MICFLLNYSLNELKNSQNEYKYSVLCKRNKYMKYHLIKKKNL